MSLEALLAELHARGVVLRAQGESLLVDAPVAVITPGIRAELLRLKPDLLARLREPRHARVHPCSCCGRFFFAEPAVVCYWCRRKRGGQELGPPCAGCGEACDRCLGDPQPENGDQP